MNKLVPLLPIGTEVYIAREQTGGLLPEQHPVKATEIPEHEHRDFCIHLQLSGNADFGWSPGGMQRIEKTERGLLIVLHSGRGDRLIWQGPSNGLILSIQPYLLSSFAADLGCMHVPEVEAEWTLIDHGLRQLIAEMGREAHAYWPLGRLYADLLSIGLQSHLLRRHIHGSAPMPEAKCGLFMPRLRRALEYITENLVCDLRLGDIAKELDLSPFHFAREFRNSAGQTAASLIELMTSDIMPTSENRMTT